MCKHNSVCNPAYCLLPSCPFSHDGIFICCFSSQRRQPRAPPPLLGCVFYAPRFSRRQPCKLPEAKVSKATNPLKQTLTNTSPLLVAGVSCCCCLCFPHYLRGVVLLPVGSESALLSSAAIGLDKVYSQNVSVLQHSLPRAGALASGCLLMGR